MCFECAHPCQRQAPRAECKRWRWDTVSPSDPLWLTEKSSARAEDRHRRCWRSAATVVAACWCHFGGLTGAKRLGPATVSGGVGCVVCSGEEVEGDDCEGDKAGVLGSPAMAPLRMLGEAPCRHVRSSRGHGHCTCTTFKRSSSAQQETSFLICVAFVCLLHMKI